MHLVVSSSELLRGIMTVSRAVPSKSAYPILENYLFVLKGNVLEITASDSEITLKTSIEVEQKEEGRMAVPARHITDLLKELPDQPVEIITGSESSFELKWMNGNSTLPYFPAEDYPEFARAEEPAVTLDFPAQTLLDGISATIYATADDEIRPTMNGIYFDIDTESTTLVASDAHKLVCYTTPEVKGSEKAAFILHKKPAAILKSIIGKNVETVNIKFDSKTVEFQFGETLAVCRLVVGKYPRYRDVIPQSNENVLTVDRIQLLNCVRRVSVCANKGSNYIKFTLTPNSLEMAAQDMGFSLEAYEKMDCDYAGEEIAIGFKSTFLIEILSNIDCGNISMKFADGSRPAVIVPAEGEELSGVICGIIMPSIAS